LLITSAADSSNDSAGSMLMMSSMAKPSTSVSGGVLPRALLVTPDMVERIVPEARAQISERRRIIANSPA
jgi:hypothetical protein